MPTRSEYVWAGYYQIYVMSKKIIDDFNNTLNSSDCINAHNNYSINITHTIQLQVWTIMHFRWCVELIQVANFILTTIYRKTVYTPCCHAAILPFLQLGYYNIYEHDITIDWS